MFIFKEVNVGMPSKLLLVQGFTLIGIGLLIFFYPQILVAIISGLFVVAGSALVGLGLRARTFSNTSSHGQRTYRRTNPHDPSDRNIFDVS